MARLHLFQVGTFEQHGLLSIAAVCRRAGHEVRLATIRNPRQVAAAVAGSGAAVAGFSATTGMHRDVLRAAAAVKAGSDALVVLGGPHATACPEVVADPGVDIVCRGEGEAALLDLLDELDGRRAPGPIANLVRQGEPIEATPLRAPETDLDALPYVDRALYHAAVGRHGAAMRYFLTGRGCPFSCTYCLGPKMRDLFGGPPVRQRSVEHVLGEICEVRERWGLESVLLGDDIFGLDKAWASEFLARYRREVGLPLVCHLRVGTFDRAFLDELRGAGCWMLSFGIESGNDRVRRQIMHRDISREEIVAAAGMVKEAGIVLETTNIVGLPTETLDEAFETVALNRDCGTDLVSVSVFQPYPGTALAERAREQGLLPEDYAERIDRTYFEGSPLRMPGIVRLVNLHKFFALLVAHPRLEPLVRRLIRLRPNPLFTLVFVVTHGLRSIRLYGLRGRRLWVAGAHWLGFFLRGGRAG